MAIDIYSRLGSLFEHQCLIHDIESNGHANSGSRVREICFDTEYFGRIRRLQREVTSARSCCLVVRSIN